MVSKTALRRGVPHGELPAFAPVPRKVEARQADDRRRESAAEASVTDGPGRLACAPDSIRGDRTNVTNSVRDGLPLPEAAEGAPGRDPRPSRQKPYKKRTPKQPFTPPDEARKAEAIAAVEAERRELADAEVERRKKSQNRRA